MGRVQEGGGGASPQAKLRCAAHVLDVNGAAPLLLLQLLWLVLLLLLPPLQLQLLLLLLLMLMLLLLLVVVPRPLLVLPLLLPLLAVFVPRLLWRDLSHSWERRTMPDLKVRRRVPGVQASFAQGQHLVFGGVQRSTPPRRKSARPHIMPVPAVDRPIRLRAPIRTL